MRKLSNFTLTFIPLWVLFFYIAPVINTPIVLFFAVMNICMLLGFIVGVLGLGLSILFKHSLPYKKTFRLQMIICIAPLLVVHAIVPMHVRVASSNDVTTNTQSPPLFFHTETVRRTPSPAGLEVLNIDRRVSQYPFRQTLELKRSCNAAYLRILSTFSNLGWPVYYPASTNRSVEATASYFYSTSLSDFVVRARDTDDGQCDIDVRSSSRNDSHDMGHNIILIDRFLETFLTTPNEWQTR